MEAPEFYHHLHHQQQSAAAGFCSPQFVNEKLGRYHLQHHSSLESKPTGGDHFVVEDLLDFSNEEDAVIGDANNGTSCGAADDAAFNAVVKGHSNDSSSVTVVDSCNSSSFSGCEPSFNGDMGHFCNDLPVPYDDMAELEWLSNFVEESFSSEDLQKLQLISGMKAHGAGPDESSETRNFQPGCCNGSNDTDNAAIIHTTGANSDDNDNINNPIFHPDMSVPAKARSKRSRTAPCNWASRLLLLSSPTASSTPEPEIAAAGPAPQHPNSGKKTVKSAAPRKRDGGGGSSDSGNGNGEGRKCLHCATDKTPQWRTGPMGPKTLCNACGVRYKSGRLVPEYRPAASPTFVLTKHSNSHRKVLELRRQKELMRVQQQQQQQFLGHHHHHHHHPHHQNMVFDVSSNGDDYLIHQHVGPDFRQLI